MTETEKKNLCKFGGKQFSLLSFLLVIPPIIWYNSLYTFYYLTPCAIIIIFSVLWNYPSIATSLHTKPLYLCDLTGDSLDVIIKDEEQRNLFNKIKDKYVLTFNITLAVVTSLAAGAILDIWLYKTKGKEDIPEIIGITGGILSIYSKVQTYIGYFLLSLFVQIKREKEKEMCFVSNLDNEKDKLEENTIKSDKKETFIELLELKGDKNNINEKNINGENINEENINEENNLENIKMDIKEKKDTEIKSY